MLALQSLALERNWIQITQFPSGSSQRVLNFPTHLNTYNGAFSNQFRPSELSDKGYKAYKRELLNYDVFLMHYDSDLEAHEGGQKKIRELTVLIQSTVSLYLQRKCCPPDRPLQEWLSNLKVKVGVDDCENQPPHASQQ